MRHTPEARRQQRATLKKHAADIDSRLTVSFYAPLAPQMVRQGFRFNEETMDLCEQCRKGCNYLWYAGMLTEKELNRVKSKLRKKIVRHLAAINKK